MLVTLRNQFPDVLNKKNWFQNRLKEPGSGLVEIPIPEPLD